MKAALSIVLAVLAIATSVQLGALHADAPTRTIIRGVTVEGPRCLICNRQALADQTLEYDLDPRTEGGRFHRTESFCFRHAGAELGYFLWPDFDKYWSSAFGIVLYLAAIVMAIKGIRAAIVDRSLQTSFGTAGVIVVAYIMSNMMTTFGKFSAMIFG